MYWLDSRNAIAYPEQASHWSVVARQLPMKNPPRAWLRWGLLKGCSQDSLIPMVSDGGLATEVPKERIGRRRLSRWWAIAIMKI
ncbi:MAG: hypothetical protein F6K50_02580 [Moorea sp. SIO3I7]|nr:hypothetical protein [Moorena sp. SIO3I7]